MHQLLTFIGECPEVAGCNALHRYWGLMSDGPHMAFELTLELITGIPLYFVGKYRANRRIRSEHLMLDAEHGIQHKETHGYLR